MIGMFNIHCLTNFMSFIIVIVLLIVILLKIEVNAILFISIGRISINFHSHFMMVSLKLILLIYFLIYFPIIFFKSYCL